MSQKARLLHVGLICLAVSWHLPIHRAAAQSGAAKASAGQPSSPDSNDPASQRVAVKLAAGGTLNGIAVDNAGVPAAHSMVALATKGNVIARLKTDAQGRFAFKPLKPGDYVVATGQAAMFIRCYELRDAPQDAVPELLLSRDAMIARGQQPIRVLLHPLVIGTVIAAAIAIPIAVSNSNNDDAS